MLNQGGSSTPARDKLIPSYANELSNEIADLEKMVSELNGRLETVKSSVPPETKGQEIAKEQGLNCPHAEFLRVQVRRIQGISEVIRAQFSTLEI